jgi:hypothetical protein
MWPDPDKDLKSLRVEGKAANGSVTLRDFDQGVIETLRAQPQTLPGQAARYYVTIPGVDGPPGWPGVPVVFSFPEDIGNDYRQPFILVRRVDITPALERYHPGLQQYRAPAPGALPVRVNFYPRNPNSVPITGYTAYQQRYQATPVDIHYNVEILARTRGAPASSIRGQANSVFMYVAKIYPPYGVLQISDDLGDKRTYEMFNEGIQNVDRVEDVQNRTIGFTLNLRAEAELDLQDPINCVAAISPLTFNFHTK